MRIPVHGANLGIFRRGKWCFRTKYNLLPIFLSGSSAMTKPTVTSWRPPWVERPKIISSGKGRENLMKALDKVFFGGTSQPWHRLRFQRLAVDGFWLDIFAAAVLRRRKISPMQPSSDSLPPHLCIYPSIMSPITDGGEHWWGRQGLHQKWAWEGEVTNWKTQKYHMTWNRIENSWRTSTRLPNNSSKTSERKYWKHTVEFSRGRPWAGRGTENPTDDFFTPNLVNFLIQITLRGEMALCHILTMAPS